MSHLIRAQRRSRSSRQRDREGSIIVLAAVFLVVMLAMLAFAIDVGMILVKRTELQAAADSVALAAASESLDSSYVWSTAQRYATLNLQDNGASLSPADLEVGYWDENARTFSTGGRSANAVKVTLRRSQAGGNPLPLSFAGVLGQQTADVSASAVALAPPQNGGTRFLIDDEFLDTDIPAIEDLAAGLGVSPDDLLSDGNGDWFIDLPPGAILELPTGQVGDVGLWDRDHPAFPFGKPGKPSLEDFLNYNENGGDLSKGGIDNPAVKKLLDPLVGVSAVDDPEVYPSYVDPDYVHVSPVFKSDVNALNPVYPQNIPTQHGVPAVNALGLRRGLLAFKIIGVGVDPDGPGGSVLPNLIIEVVDPSTVDISQITGSTNTKPKLVQ